MKIVHISDSHGLHEKLEIPKCDVLIHSGDLGGRTTLKELMSFLVWFEKQPATKKIFIAGNHDICLDKNEAKKEKDKGNIYSWSRILDEYKSAIDIIDNYDVKYLCNTDYVYEGVKFYGSPYSPSFHRECWAFNADRGEEIRNIWGRIPTDTNVLITHTPVYGIHDDVKEYKQENEMDAHVGCKDLLEIIKKRLHKLKLCCFGHIHDNYGVTLNNVSNTRRVLFSNGAVLTNRYDVLVTKPLIITI